MASKKKSIRTVIAQIKEVHVKQLPDDDSSARSTNTVHGIGIQ